MIRNVESIFSPYQANKKSSHLFQNGFFNKFQRSFWKLTCKNISLSFLNKLHFFFVSAVVSTLKSFYSKDYIIYLMQLAFSRQQTAAAEEL